MLLKNNYICWVLFYIQGNRGIRIENSGDSVSYKNTIGPTSTKRITPYTPIIAVLKT